LVFMVNRNPDTVFSASRPPPNLINLTSVGLTPYREPKQSCGMVRGC